MEHGSRRTRERDGMGRHPRWRPAKRGNTQLGAIRREGPRMRGGGGHTIGYFIPSSVVLFCKIKNCPLRCELQMHRRDGYIWRQNISGNHIVTQSSFLWVFITTGQESNQLEFERNKIEYLIHNTASLPVHQSVTFCLCFNRTHRYVGVLGEWRSSFAHSWPRQ